MPLLSLIFIMSDIIYLSDVLMASKHSSVSIWESSLICNISVWVITTDNCVEVSFFYTAGAFLFRFERSPNDIVVLFIKHDTLGVPLVGRFIEIIINALRASRFSVLLLLVLIRLIVRDPPIRVQAILTWQV